MERMPRVVAVAATGNTELLVEFDNGIKKMYDITPWLSRPEFQLLKTPAFFKAVQVDSGRYGIFWNDNIDLAEAELWINGKECSA